MPRYAVKRTNEEINNVLNSANAWEEKGGSGVPGMSYEQGVKMGIDWILGDNNDPPIESEPDED